MPWDAAESSSYCLPESGSELLIRRSSLSTQDRGRTGEKADLVCRALGLLVTRDGTGYRAGPENTENPVISLNWYQLSKESRGSQ